jgi:lipopolysaccharide transport system ATP-binding protein
VDLEPLPSGDTPWLRITDVHKNYQLGELSNLKRTLRHLSRRARVREVHAFSALDGVSLDVQGGTAVGLVGHNGSGKSTLLHLISGITLPTSGVIQIRGRVLPLFAVGTGFHPELTGRENIVLFGAVLGVKPRIVQAQTDPISAFAEIDEHLDTPLKRYSDGMKARLSFSIAMCFPADIYIFDEVLAVVDSGFRERCLSEIEKLRDAGKLVLFVSHNVEQVQRICTHSLWLERGRVRSYGPSSAVLPEYERDLIERNRASGPENASIPDGMLAARAASSPDT